MQATHAISWYRPHGSYAGYAAVSEMTLHPFPNDVEPKHTVLVEPTNIGVRAVIQNSHVSPDDRVMVPVQCFYASMYKDFERSLRLITLSEVDHATFPDDRFSLLEAD